MIIPLKLTRKKLLIGSGVLFALIAAGCLLWLQHERNNSTPGVAMVSVDEAATTALNYSEQGDTAGGLAYYDSQINGRTNKDEKYQLLLYKANFAIQAKAYSVAISAAKQADSIKATPGSAAILARAYEGEGDKKQALIYYKKALQLSPKDGMGANSNFMYEAKIKELQS